MFQPLLDAFIESAPIKKNTFKSTPPPPKKRRGELVGGR